MMAPLQAGIGPDDHGSQVAVDGPIAPLEIRGLKQIKGQSRVRTERELFENEQPIATAVQLGLKYC
jgi:hypothetical protein